MGVVPYKRGPTELRSPFHHVRTQRKGTGYEQGRGSSSEGYQAGSLILDFRSPKL